MKKIVILAGLLVSTLLSARAQVIIQNGAGVTTTGAITITLDNIDLVNHDPQTNLTGSTLHLKGNGNNGLGGVANWKAWNIIMDKAGGIVLLQNGLQVANSLQFQQGKLDLNGQVLTLLPSANIVNENEINRIIGPSGGAVRISLPMNTPSALNAGNLGAVITSNSNLGMVTIQRSHIVGQFQGTAIARKYEIIPANNQQLNATLRIHYLDAELNNLSEAGLQLFTSRQPNAWEMETGSLINASLNYAEKTGLGSFHTYTVSSAVALPLFWGQLKAQCDNNTLLVQWETLQEEQTSQFVVERSPDGYGWSSVHSQPAAGNSTTARQYRFEDKNATDGNNWYYRVKAIDQDGRMEYSKTLMVKSCGSTTSINLFPVPASTTTTLYINAAGTYLSFIRIAGADGKIFRQQKVSVQQGSNQFILNINSLVPGTYYVQIAMPDQSVKTIPFIKK
jgi:hypothetical protein